jgi:2-keto-4-pentenoate hydratase/2-oxohepta-3-ene-1,7-dioic acid hydratase in catechol pathway
MKFVSFNYQGLNSWGVVDGDSVADLGNISPSLLDFIASTKYSDRAGIAAKASRKIPLSAIRYLPVIVKPEKIVCLVRNYMDHHNEAVAAGLKVELSSFPPLFIRYPCSQVGHGEPILRPIVSEQLDFEGELAVIIGKRGRHIPVDTAMDHVAGYSVYNDGSVREFQFHAKQIAAGKNFENTGGFGPFMVTADEIADPHNLNLETRLNGQRVQSSNTKHMIFNIPRMINYASQIFALVPGDVIVTGTPSGVGFSRKPPLWMKAGDVVEVEIEKVGLLRNPVANETAR